MSTTSLWMILWISKKALHRCQNPNRFQRKQKSWTCLKILLTSLVICWIPYCKLSKCRLLYSVIELSNHHLPKMLPTSQRLITAVMTIIRTRSAPTNRWEPRITHFIITCSYSSKVNWLAKSGKISRVGEYSKISVPRLSQGYFRSRSSRRVSWALMKAALSQWWVDSIEGPWVQVTLITIVRLTTSQTSNNTTRW